MIKEQILRCLAVLKEVEQQFRPNTNIDTAIKSYEAELNEIQKLENYKIVRNFLFIFVAIVALAGCKTKERLVTVIENHTDTLWQKQTVHDSIHVHDSIYVNQYLKGDTVVVEKQVWHTAWRERVKTDTVYKSKIDSVPVPYPVIKEVPAELSRWQKAKMNFGLVFMGVMGAGAVYGGWRLKRKLLP